VKVLTDDTTGRWSCGIGSVAKGKNDGESSSSAMVFEAGREGFNSGNWFGEGWSSSWVLLAVIKCIYLQPTYLHFI
jgi:hypothetical protein